MGVWNEEWIKSCKFHVTLPTDRVAESTTGHCFNSPRDLLFQTNPTFTPTNLITKTSTHQIAADGGSNTTEAEHQCSETGGCPPNIERTKPRSITSSTHRTYDHPTQRVISSISTADPAQYLEASDVLGNETQVSWPTTIPVILASTRSSSAEYEPSAVFPEASFLDNADMDPVKERQENADLADGSNFPQVGTEGKRGPHPHNWTSPVFDQVHNRPVGLTVR